MPAMNWLILSGYAIGAALLAAGAATSRSTNPDTRNSAVVPQVAGLAILLGTGLLMGIYGAVRLLS